MTGYAKSGSLALWLTLYSEADPTKDRNNRILLNTNKASRLHAWLRQALAQIPPPWGFSFRTATSSLLFFSDDVILSQPPWDATSRIQSWGLSMFNMTSSSFLPPLCSVSYGISCSSFLLRIECLQFYQTIGMKTWLKPSEQRTLAFGSWMFSGQGNAVCSILSLPQHWS